MRNRWITTRAAAAAALCTAALASPAVAQQPAEIVIGAPNSITGGFGEAGQRVVLGLQMAADEVNRQGGIKSLGGAKLKVIVVDTSSDNPAQAASVTRRLVTQDKAIVLVGAHTSTMTLSAQIEAERAEVPLLTTSYADAITERGYKYTFKLPPKASNFLAKGMDYATEMLSDVGRPLKRIAVYSGSDAAGQAFLKASSELAKQRNLDIVASVSFPAGLTDPTPVVSATVQNKPELIFLNSFTTDVILITRALRAVGIATPIVSGGGGVSTNSTGAALGKAADGLMGLVAFNWDLPIEGVKDFIDRYRKQHPDQPYPPAYEALGEGYALGQVIQAALEKSASTDPKKLRDTIATLDMPALLPGEKVGFDEQGLNKYAVPIMVSWIDGQLRTVWPKKYQSRPPVL
jgi:branched-chain amino acid transport system substrate-binding protein